jgi:hypothetical protein
MGGGKKLWGRSYFLDSGATDGEEGIIVIIIIMRIQIYYIIRDGFPVYG